MEDAIVLYPSPGRGHQFSMVELGKLITQYYPSISITIIIFPLPTDETSPDSFLATVSATNPGINVIHLPKLSNPPIITNSSSPLDFIASLCDVVKLNSDILHQTLLNISKSFNIKALVLDMFCYAAFEYLSSRLKNIPTYCYFTSGASGLSLFLYLPILDKTIKKSLKDLDIIVAAPGIPKIPSKDMPPLICDRSHRVYQYLVDTAKQMIKSAGLIVNTFESLEQKALMAIRGGECAPNEPVPPIFCVGPLVTAGKSESEHECLTWLDSQPSRSVLFLCFGSLGVFSSSQLKEMAVGLEKCGVRFLWVVRASPPAGNTSTSIELCLDSLLPNGFLDRTKGKGFIVKSWAPQVEILNHSSVGGFVTHCGWNSILEALCAGVPMLAWPLYAEQKMNRIFLVEEMKVAIDVKEADEDGFVIADELEEKVVELMNSKKGEAVRERIMEFRKNAMAARSDGGSSCVAMAKLLDSIKEV